MGDQQWSGCGQLATRVNDRFGVKDAPIPLSSTGQERCVRRQLGVRIRLDNHCRDELLTEVMSLL